MVFLLQSWLPTVSILLFVLFAVLPVDALPRNRLDKTATLAVAKAAATGATTKATTKAVKVTAATDGSTILDKTVVINGLSIRYKISAPATSFTTASGVAGAAAASNSNGTAGLNVLLHGDGGQSFVDFPNQAVQDNLMGVVVLAPNKNLFWGGGSGLQRTDGVAHAAAVNSLIQNQLPLDVAFDSSQVFFTGVSGGSLLLSGFFIPAFMSQYQTGVLLNCGALTPQVDIVDGATMIANTKIHYQSTQSELTLLQPAIPAAIKAYEALATSAGLSAAQIGALQTADNSPTGGHCAFDGKGFVSGIQIMATAYSNIMQTGATGVVAGIKANVLKTVVGNENLKFAAAQ
jgi:hypothetical protein